MEYLFGMKTNDFVLLAADQGAFGQIHLMKKDHDKSFRLGEKTVMLVVGDGGDPHQFAEYVEKNIQLYKMRNGYELSPKAAASYTRKVVADNLRTAEAYFVNTILGGYDDRSGSYLCLIDHFGTQFEGPFVMHGYGGFLCYSIMDKLHRNDMTQDEAIAALKTCLQELKRRFMVNLPSFKVQLIDKDGIKVLDDPTE